METSQGDRAEKTGNKRRLAAFLVVAVVLVTAVIVFIPAAQVYSYPVVGKGIRGDIFYYQGYNGCQYAYSLTEGTVTEQSKEPLGEAEADSYRTKAGQQPTGVEPYTDLLIDTPDEWLFIENKEGDDWEWRLVSRDKQTGETRTIKRLKKDDAFIIASHSWLQGDQLFLFGSQEWGISRYQIVEDEKGISDIKLVEEALDKTRIPFLVAAAPWIIIGLIIAVTTAVSSPVGIAVLLLLVGLLIWRVVRSRRKGVLRSDLPEETDREENHGEEKQ